MKIVHCSCGRSFRASKNAKALHAAWHRIRNEVHHYVLKRAS